MSNIVLVHGAWCDGSSWSKVIASLQAEDHNVLAVQNPLTSLEADVATTVKFASQLEGPIVLVGHSYGGVVISLAASSLPATTALVYVAAFATDLGENLDAINNRYEPSEGAQAITSRDGEYLIVLPDRFPDVFAADIDAREASVLAAVQKPTAIASFAAQAGQPGFRALPSWYLISDEDRMIDPRAQEFMAQRAGSQTRHVGSSHASPVSHPHEVTDIILAALG